MQLSELKQLCLDMKAKREELDEVKDRKKILEGEFERLKKEIIEHLDNHDLKNFDFGEGKVIAVDKFNTRVVDKYALAEFLKMKGMFEDLFTFNAQTMNSFYKVEMEASDDIDFTVPGMSEPTLYRNLQLRKK